MKKKKLIGFGLTALAVATVGAIGLTSMKLDLVNALFHRDPQSSYSLTLNSSNSVSTDGDFIKKTAVGNDVTFTYSNVATNASGHTRINNGGTVVNKTQITSIDSFTAVFSNGTLRARIAYVVGTWSEYFTLVSGSKVEFASKPYFLEINAPDAYVNLTSAKYTYTCAANPDASSQETGGSYDITFKTYSSDNTTPLTTSNATAEIDSGSDYIYSTPAISNVYQGQYGLKIGKSGEFGSIKFNMRYAKVTEDIVSIELFTEQYGNDTGKFEIFINGSTTPESTKITPANGGTIVLSEPTNLKSLTIETTSKRAYLYGISLNYGSSGPVTPDNPSAYEVGYSASDANKNEYTTNSIFDNDNALVVMSNKSDGTSSVVSSGNYSYVVKNSSGVAINTAAKFPATGVYTLVVSYGTYTPTEIILNVGDYIYMVDIAASMTVTTFNTADVLSNYLTGNITASITYSDNSSATDISYAEFASKGLGVKLIRAGTTSYPITSPFGSAGAWSVRVYSLTDEANTYYDISITVNAIPVASITLSESSYTLNPNGQLQLTATVSAAGPNDPTNSSVTWASSKESVATVSETGLVTAVAVGSTTITATAVDGTGVYGSCAITVEASSEPAWTEVTDASRLEIGDVIVIAYEGNTNEELSGISDTSTKYGLHESYSSTPNGIYALTICAGASSNNYSLKHGSNYLCWTSGNTLNVKSTVDSSSSWTFSGTSNILNANDSTRKIQYNTGSPRFACYTTTQSAITIYKQTNSTPVTPVYPTFISLSGTASSISIGGTSQLTVNYSPSETNVKEVIFVSANENVATVSDNGLITGIAQGTTTITAAAEGANGTTKEATFSITVTPISVTGVTLDRNSETVKVSKTTTLVATVSPSNATNKAINWSSSNTAVATVSNTGVVTGVSAGNATITVTTVDGSKTATCAITVTAASGGEETFSITYTDLPTAYQTGSTVYTADSGIKFQAYNCANYSSKMQWKASSGYLQSTEDLELQSITINDRESNTLKVYGSNTAGSFTVEISGTNDVYDLTGYSYFKIARTSNGAAYCSSITVVTGTPTPTDPTSIILSPTSADVGVGGTKQLSVSYVPANANQNKEVTWTSSNTNVATVSNTGLVSVKSTATAGQTATITAELTKFSSITATCTITVVAQQQDDHTVLIYMCGADLESENHLATGDIQEILKVSGQPDDVNIVIETGGASSWASTYGISSTKLERWHVENKSLVKDDSLTYASMGLASTLQSFIEYGLNNYPAERTGLVFWNHGGGMRGVCYDEKKNDDVLKNSEIRTAVSGALNNCGMSGQKLEWVGYDACLMAVQDIAETNSAYFNYMIASEESEAGYGWDYDTWVDDLYAKKTTTNILKAIVDGFIADNGGANSSSGDQTLSYLNLAHATAYKNAWEAMAEQLYSKLNQSNKYSFNQAIINNVKHYADSDYDYFCTFDAWDFIDKLANNSAFSSFRIDSSYTTAVKNAHANLVAYNLAQKGAGVSKGLCMYWCNNTQYSDISTYYTTSETNFTQWRKLNADYGYHA